jgi:hypothetical protein
LLLFLLLSLFSFLSLASWHCLTEHIWPFQANIRQRNPTPQHPAQCVLSWECICVCIQKKPLTFGVTLKMQYTEKCKHPLLKWHTTLHGLLGAWKIRSWALSGRGVWTPISKRKAMRKHDAKRGPLSSHDKPN